MKSKYHNYDASIHKIVNGKIVNKSVRELIEDQKKRDQAARELSAIGIKITAFWKKLLTFGWGDGKVFIVDGTGRNTTGNLSTDS